jgi:iron complex outermembrane receptor protein
MKGQSRRFSGTEAVLLSSLGLICATHANAQTADQAPGQAPLQLQQVVVTGTLIPTNPDAVAVPVTSLDANQLAQTGVTANALDMLRKAIPAFAGRSNAGSSNAQNQNQFTAGGSQIQLRNLPTLVLVDGQRLAVDAVAGLSGSKTFVDVSQVPAAALQRVDVLTDGASSLYGADAVGGVVNFILKQNYDGLRAGAQYGAADGGYNQQSYFVTAGHDVGPVNITATLSYNRTSPLWQYTRSFASPMYGVTAPTSLPGVAICPSPSPTTTLPADCSAAGTFYLANGLTTPTLGTGASTWQQLVANGVYSTSPASKFDYSRYAMLLQQEQHENFVATINSKPLFGGNVKAFGDILLSRNKVQSTAWAASGTPFSATTVTVPATSPYDPLTQTATGVTFADSSLPKGVYDTTDAYRLTAGLKGRLAGGWTWQSTLDYSESKLTEDDTNLLNGPNVQSAVNSGTLNPFAVSGLGSAALANLYGTEMLHGDSKLYSWDAHSVGHLFHLPAGAVDLAAGVNWRREQISGHADPNNANWAGGLTTEPFTYGHEDSAVYAETRVPITASRMRLPGLDQFELTLADRFEHYSDVGNGQSPKFGFRWAPFDNQFVINGTYTKSFAAPPLFQTYGPTPVQHSTGHLIAIVFGNSYSDIPYFNGGSPGNPALQPSTSVARSIGFTFRPKRIQGLSLKANYSSIDLFGFPGGSDLTYIMRDVNQYGSASRYFNNVTVGGVNGSHPFGTPGSLQAYLTNPDGTGNVANAENLYVMDQFLNLSVLVERSWTAEAMYILPWSQYGTWTLSTNVMSFDSFKYRRHPTDPYQQFAGNASNVAVFAGTLPKYRFYTTLDWTFGNLDLTLANTYVSAVKDTGPAGNLPGIWVPSYSTFDLIGSYDIPVGSRDSGRDVKLTVGINNIGNTMPPIFPRAFSATFTNTDLGTYSPIGRYIYGGVTATF